MKRILNVLIVLFLTQSISLAQDDEMQLLTGKINSQNILDNQALIPDFMLGFQNAFSFYKTLQERLTIFNAGINSVINGEFNLMFASFITDRGSNYIAHILYGQETHEGQEWIRIKHGSYINDAPIWHAAFAEIFKEIQNEVKKPLACLIMNDDKNLIWINALKTLGFIPDESFSTPSGGDYTWFLKPIN